MKKLALTITLVTSIAIFPSHSEATYAVYDAKNHSENLAAKVQLIEQVKNSAKQLENDIKNLQKLDVSSLNKSYAQITGVIERMEKIRSQTDAIGTEYNDLMTSWATLNPNYEDWNGVSSERYAKQTERLREHWSKALLQALGMTSIASSGEQYKTEQSLNSLLNESQNASGTMGALQAANQLTGLMISEQQKLQVLMAESLRSQSLYYQQRIDAENQGKQLSENFLSDSNKYRGTKIARSGGTWHKFEE